MTKAYVETTVLTDALLKPGSRSTTARAAIARFTESLLPVYAIKEFKAGPLRRFVWFHGKLFTTKSWAKTVEQLRKMAGTPQRYFTSTAVESLEAASRKTQRVTLGRLVEKYGASATQDVVLCDQYRLALGSIIRQAWKKRREITSSVVHSIPCYPETEIVEERGIFELGEVHCRPKVECSLASELRRNQGILRTLRDAVEAQPQKPENTRRAKVPRELIRVPQMKLTDQQCRQLGDAIFAFFCPTDAVILSTNTRDLRPLAAGLGKKVETP